MNRAVPGRAPVRQDVDDVGDHVARALDDDGVPHPDVQALDLVGVVERGPADGGAGDPHRLETGGGRERARPADVDVDGDDPGGPHLGGELVRDGPSRVVGRRAQSPVVDEAIDFHDGAVRVVAEAIPLGLEPLTVTPDLVQGRTPLAARVRREPALPERRKHLRMGLERERISMAQLVYEHPEIPARRHAGVFLTHRPGRGIAGVGERRLALGLQLPVEPLEGRVAHVDLATDLEAPALRERSDETERDRAEGPEVRGHVLPEPTVAAGRTPLEHAVLVQESHPEAIHFGLTDVAEVHAGQGALDPRLELSEVRARSWRSPATASAPGARPWRMRRRAVPRRAASASLG